MREIKLVKASTKYMRKNFLLESEVEVRASEKEIEFKTVFFILIYEVVEDSRSLRPILIFDF